MRARYKDSLACAALAGLVDGFEKNFKTPLCIRIEEALKAIDEGDGV